MQSEFEKWVEENRENYDSEGIDNILNDIAENYGFINQDSRKILICL